MIHHLKIKKEYADAICGTAKTFEVRKEDDKYYDMGDIVIFHVVDKHAYHDIEEMAYFVPYVLRHKDFPEGIPEGYCVFAITPLSNELAYYYTKYMRENQIGLIKG